MKSFAEKVREARRLLDLSQTELGESAGISMKSILEYEKGRQVPHRSTMARLADALHVSVRYLSDDSCDDPAADIEQDAYLEEVRQRYGAKASRDVSSLLQENVALFAGGELSQDEKDAFFQAVMRAYVASSEEAKKKFGH